MFPLFGPSFYFMKHFVNNTMYKHRARLEAQEGHQGLTPEGKACAY